MSSSRVKRYLSLFFWATGVALSLRLFLIEDYRVFSDSMAPSLLAGDLIFVSKSKYNLRLPFSTYELVRFRRPKRGEVVAFTLPDHGLETFVKRVVGLEGDEVAIQKGRLLINGSPVTYPGEPDKKTGTRLESIEGSPSYRIAWSEGTMANFGPVQVPPGYFFAMGDNRANSIDSRSWGPVPYSCLKGKVAFLWFSLGPEGARFSRMAQWVR